jgi:hypothetical protein
MRGSLEGRRERSNRVAAIAILAVSLAASACTAILGVTNITPTTGAEDGGGSGPGGSSGGGSSSGGSPGDGSTCQPYVPPSSFHPSSPQISFSTEVMPIFRSSCGLASCHGSVTSPQAGIYLGNTTLAGSASDDSQVYANLIDVASADYPSMERVKPGDLANSYLLHRIDNDACTLPNCTTTACAELMPQGSPQLGISDLNTVRAWIAQGALNDNAGTPLPCDINLIIVPYCQSCHSDPPANGAPMPLVTWEDFHALTPADSIVPDSGTYVYQSCQFRISDNLAPQPPPPNPILNATDVATLDSWFDAGAPKSDGVVCGDAGPD